MHIFVEGPSGSVLSAKVERLARQALAEKVCPYVNGYQTWHEHVPGDERKLVYIDEWDAPHVPDHDRYIGCYLDGQFISSLAAFERFAPLLAAAPAGGLTVLDTLGIMEEHAPMFKAAVLEMLDRPGTVLAAIRDIDTPFLNQLRRRGDVRIFSLGAPDEGIYAALKEEFAKN